MSERVFLPAFCHRQSELNYLPRKKSVLIGREKGKRKPTCITVTGSKELSSALKEKKPS